MPMVSGTFLAFLAIMMCKKNRQSCILCDVFCIPGHNTVPYHNFHQTIHFGNPVMCILCTFDTLQRYLGRKYVQISLHN